VRCGVGWVRGLGEECSDAAATGSATVVVTWAAYQLTVVVPKLPAPQRASRAKKVLADCRGKAPLGADLEARAKALASGR
jgi:hypothetical protein